MAILGSKRARAILGDLKDDNYKASADSLDYDAALEKLQKEFAPLTEADWNRNCYFSWLYVLKALLKDGYEEGYPTFMRQPAWVDKQINAALSSWSQLRHSSAGWKTLPPIFARVCMA
jgi:hypothetical protein